MTCANQLSNHGSTHFAQTLWISEKIAVSFLHSSLFAWKFVLGKELQKHIKPINYPIKKSDMLQHEWRKEGSIEKDRKRERKRLDWNKSGLRPVSRLLLDWSLNWVLVVMLAQNEINQIICKWCNEYYLTLMQLKS